MVELRKAAVVRDGTGRGEGGCFVSKAGKDVVTYVDMFG